MDSNIRVERVKQSLGNLVDQLFKSLGRLNKLAFQGFWELATPDSWD